MKTIHGMYDITTKFIIYIEKKFFFNKTWQIILIIIYCLNNFNFIITYNWYIEIIMNEDDICNDKNCKLISHASRTTLQTILKM